MISVKAYPSGFLTVLFAALLTLLAASSALAQKVTTSVRGHVSDETGAILSGATVKLEQTTGSLSRQAITDERGEYRFDTLLIGNYELSASAPGFEEARLAVNLADNYKLDVVKNNGSLH